MGSSSRSLIMLLMAAVLLLFSSDSDAFDEVLLIPWGSGDGRVAQRWEPSGSYGPTDFEVSHSSPERGQGTYLSLLDSEQDLVQVFDLVSKSFMSASPIPRGSERLALKDDRIVVWDGTWIHVSKWGEAFRCAQPGIYPFRVAERLGWHQDHVVVFDESGRCFEVILGENPLDPETVRRIETPQPCVTRSGRNSFAVTAGGEHLCDTTHDSELGAVEYLGAVAGLHLVLTEEVLSGSPIEARELLFVFTGDGLLRNVVPVPFVYYSLFPRSFGVFGDSLFCFVSSPRGLHLLVADPQRLASGDLSFPFFPEEPYHYNYHVPQAPPKKWEGGMMQEDPVSRSEMMATARGYVDLLWTASLENITEGIERMPDGTYVRTPSWVTVGPKQKVPYKWGGFTSLSEFADGVLAGKKCGDDYTQSMGTTDLYCIGVDCSGLVSRCWGTETKYKSATMHLISSELPSFQDMRRGDALNKPHHHIRLCAEDNPPGMVLTMEAGGDWRVSYHALKLTSLTSYVPIRFDQVIEEDPIGPFAIRVKDSSQVLPVRRGPSTEESVITNIAPAGQFVSTCHHHGWYHFHVPTGTGTYGGWVYGDTMSATASLEGSQETPIAYIVAQALNARVGPGMGYAYVTTVSEGQQFAILGSAGQWYELQIANIPGHETGWVWTGASGLDLDVEAGGPKDGYGAGVISLSYPCELNEQETRLCTLQISNTGCCSWDESTLLRTTVPRERSSLFAAQGWIDSSTIAAVGVHVLPYQTHVLSFAVQAPCVAADTILAEYLGFEQAGFCWFGDSNQMGPPDSAIALSILVRDVGIPAPPVIDPGSVAVHSGALTFSWAVVNGAIYYGIFRGEMGSSLDPVLVTTTADQSFTSAYGVGDPGRNIYYHVRAYAPADSSALSNAVGEFDYAGISSRAK